MQYKIPVQIENEDPIVLWLSLRQLAIIMVAAGLWYSIFKGLVGSTAPEIAALPWIILTGIAFMIAKFKIAEMTFMQFILSFIRLKSNIEKRHWQQWIDSFSPLNIGFIRNQETQKDSKIDFQSKIDKINNIDEKLKNI